jgi:hypothetical protein
VSVCGVSKLPEEGTLEVLFQGGNARFLQLFNTLLRYSIIVLCCQL